jgi:hypothetical protein
MYTCQRWTLAEATIQITYKCHPEKLALHGVRKFCCQLACRDSKSNLGTNFGLTVRTGLRVPINAVTAQRRSSACFRLSVVDTEASKTRNESASASMKMTRKLSTYGLCVEDINIMDTVPSVPIGLQLYGSG